MREKSRLRIEHPDLPESLRDAAGEMVGALWQRAQAEALSTLGALRHEADANVQAAQNVAEDALKKQQAAEAALESASQTGASLQQQVNELQASLGRAQGELAAQQRQIDLAMAQRQELQQALATARDQFTRELEQQRTAIATAEERHAADMKRALLDIDRERVQLVRTQKDLEQARRIISDQAEHYRMLVAERQTQVETLRHRNGELEGVVTELRTQRDQIANEIDGMRQQVAVLALEKTSAKRRTKRVSESSKVVKASPNEKSSN